MLQTLLHLDQILVADSPLQGLQAASLSTKYRQSAMLERDSELSPQDRVATAIVARIDASHERATIYAANKRILQELQESLPHGCDLLCVLQFLPRASNFASDPRDGSWACGSRLDFGRIGFVAWIYGTHEGSLIHRISIHFAICARIIFADAFKYCSHLHRLLVANWNPFSNFNGDFPHRIDFSQFSLLVPHAI